MNTLRTLAIGTVLAVATLTVAQALPISPTSPFLVMTGDQATPANPRGVPAIVSEIEEFLNIDITEQYKQDLQPSAESGSFAGSYQTSLSPNGDESGGTITYTGGSILTGNIYLLIKDGDSDPSFYLFNITGWNGTETITLANFWAGDNGSISHLSLYTAPSTSVPDGGVTVALLGLALT